MLAGYRAAASQELHLKHPLSLAKDTTPEPVCKHTFHRPVLHSSLPSPSLDLTSTAEPALECQGRASRSCVSSSCTFSSPHHPCGSELPQATPVVLYRNETHPQTGKLAASWTKALHRETTNPFSSRTPSLQSTASSPCPAAAESHHTLIHPALGHPAPSVRR